MEDCITSYFEARYEREQDSDPSPNTEPTEEPDQDLSHLCPRAFTLMRHGTENWDLHKLSNARELADRADCWTSLENVQGIDSEPQYNGPECAQTILLTVRGTRRWNLHTLTIARSRWEAGTCRAYF